MATMATTEENPSVRRWTADEVWRMVEVGLLDDDDRYELLDGALLAVTPQGEEHFGVLTELMERLMDAYRPAGFTVRCQGPIGGISDAIPEPDLAVVPAGPRRVAPHVDETVLLIEIAMTSHARDRRKASVYAAHGAPQLWTVDLVRRELLVHRDPLESGDWGAVARYVAGESVRLPEVDTAIPVEAMLRPEAPQAR